MVALKITNVGDKKYTLLNVESNETYQFSLTFYGLETLPQVGDFIAFHEELLDKNYIEYSDSYQFGPLNEVYGRQVKSSKDVDVIQIILRSEKLYLKRFFG